MEEETGLELRLGLSLGGSKPSHERNPDATPNPKRNLKQDEESSTQNFTNLFQNHSLESASDEASRVRVKQNGGAEGQGGPSSILIDLTKSSHLSINTGDGSVGENDDVAESHETEGSNYNSDNKGGASASGVAINSFSSGVPVSFQSANHAMMPSGGERATPAQQVAFGYSSVQLPTLETNPAWVYGTRMESKELAQEDEKKSQALQEALKPNQDAHTQTEQTNTTKPNPNPNSNPNPIRRGLSPNIMFGGSGSRPDLPWVTTTGSGPGGKSISGVTYKHSRDQIRIVCACHGTHMSPEEFVKHAS